MKKYGGIIKLSILLLLAPVIIWKLAIGQTFGLYQENRHLTNSSPDSISQVSTGRFFPPAMTTTSLLGDGTILQQFADVLVKENLSTVSYTPAILGSEGGYHLRLGTWALTGRFVNLVRLVSYIEQQTLPLRISSVHFETSNLKPTGRQAEKVLTMTLSFISIEK